MNMSTEVITTWVAVIGFFFTYLKDKNEAAHKMGKLEQKVEDLHKEIDKVDALRSELHGNALILARIEAQISEIATRLAKLDKD